MIEQARQSAQRFRDEERERARVEADAFLSNARSEIKRERDAAIEDVRHQFADLAILAAERVVRPFAGQGMLTKSLSSRPCRKAIYSEERRLMARRPVAKRYAQAAFAIAQEQGRLEEGLPNCKQRSTP